MGEFGEYLETVFKVVESSLGNSSRFCSSLQSFSTLRLLSSNGLAFSLPLCRIQKQNFVVVVVFLIPSAKMWVPVLGFNHSLVCFEWSLQAKIQRQTGVAGYITNGFYPNPGIFFPHHLNWKRSVEFFFPFFLFFFLFTMGWLLSIQLLRYHLSKKADPS